MLTARQLVTIATGNTTPPFHLSDISKLYTIKPFSLRSAANLAHAQKTYLLLEIRDVGLLKNVSSYAQLEALFKPSGPRPSKATLVQLSKTLSAAGVSIKYVSSDFRRVGIAGTLESLAGVRVALMHPLAGPTPAAAQSTEAIHTEAVTPAQWVAILGGVVVVAAFVGALASGGALGAAVVAVIQATATVGQANLVVASLAGTGAGVIGSIIAYEIAGISPAPVVCLPSQASSLPVDASDAGTGVLTTQTSSGLDSGGIFDAYQAPDVDASSLPAVPSATSDAGDPAFGDPAKGSSDKGKDSSDKGKESSDKSGKDGTKEGKDGKDDKDGKEVKDGKEGGKDDKEGKESKDGKEGGKDDKEGKESKDGKEGGKEASDTKGKDTSDVGTGKESSDLGGDDAPSAIGEASMWLNADTAGDTAVSPAARGKTKPASLLTRSPVV
jgi:hypothetical protein